MQAMEKMAAMQRGDIVNVFRNRKRSLE